MLSFGTGWRLTAGQHIFSVIVSAVNWSCKGVGTASRRLQSYIPSQHFQGSGFFSRIDSFVADAEKPLFMRSLISLLSVSAALVAGVTLLPVVASDFDARETTDPLDVFGADGTSAERPAELNAPLATLRQDELKESSRPAQAAAKTPKVNVLPDVVRVITGEASWYGPGFYGNRTANGEVFRPGTMTAAHRTLPFGTKVRVTNLWNGRSAIIRINDRGPFIDHRVIDLGHGAASSLGLIASGIAQVRLEVLR